MNLKRLAAGMLAIALAVTSVTGCSKTSTDKKEDKVAMGRYVEKTIEMPEAVVSNKEEVYEEIKNPDGNIEIYTVPRKVKDGEYKIQYTLGADNKWTRSVPKWLNFINDFFYVAYAPDETKYFMSCNYSKNKAKIYIIKNPENKNAVEILSKEYKQNEMNEVPMRFRILKDNSVLLVSYGYSSIYKEGIEKSSFKIGGMSYSVFGNKMLCMNEKQDGGQLIDVNTGKTLKEVPMDKSSSSIFTADKDGNWYMANTSGVHRMVKNGNSWETILDGDLASMCSPSMDPSTIIIGDKDDFYIFYSKANAKTELKYYVYNKYVPTAPSKTLTVVSLEENDTVRQAIGEFQHKNQDVKVDYKVLMSEDNGMKVNDYIKTINTELLAGNGEDIFILDGMPVDSYIEKGVLMDLSGIINPMVKKGYVLNNIMKNFKKNGKIYNVPIRYSLVVAYGGKEAVKAADSIQTLADYVKSSANIPLLGEISYSKLAKTMFQLYSGSFLSDKGIERNKLIKFLQELKEISVQTHATEQETEKLSDDNTPMDNVTKSELLESKRLNDKKAILDFVNISHMSEGYAPITARDMINGELATVNNEFIPNGLVGINNASKQKALASEFILSLFSENTQKAELGDGFPVNTKSLENFNMRYSDFWWDIGDGFVVEQPDKDKMKSLLNLCKTVDKPIETDQKLLDMVISETGYYLGGETDVETTADKIIEKTKAYLKE